MTTQNVFLLGDLGNMSEGSALASKIMIEKDLRFTTRKMINNVNTKEAEFPAHELLYEIIDGDKDHTISAVGEFNEPYALIDMSVSRNNISYSISSDTREAINHWKKQVESWSESIVVVSNKVSVNFWAMGAQGPQNWTRSIEVPQWSDIRENYADNIKLQLDRIINRDFTETEGKLALLHGIPGSGKTYALRALLQAWKDNATVSYIVDPERFLNAQPSYMLQLVLDSADKYGYLRYNDEDDSDVKETHYHLLIMEDTGELLSADAKDRAGQGLSRLLNLVDGMIGQGINLMVFITTNEHINTFHPAVTRDGRCLATMEIGKLSTIEANDWLRSHGSYEHVREEKTLAELYAIINKSTKPVEEEEIHAGQYL